MRIKRTICKGTLNIPVMCICTCRDREMRMYQYVTWTVNINYNEMKQQKFVCIRRIALLCHQYNMIIAIYSCDTRVCISRMRKLGNNNEEIAYLQ